MTTPLRLAVISPDPLDNSQGVERFCHSLASSVKPYGIDASVIAAGDYDDRDADVVLTNVFDYVRTAVPRVHVYHGCHIPQIARSHAESSMLWRAKYMAEAGVREFRAGIGATRVSVSDSCAKEIRRWYQHESGVITNGIDTDVFRATNKTQARQLLQIDEARRVALFIGRPEWRKRPDIAAKAAQDHGFDMYLASGRPFKGMNWLGKLPPESLALAISAADVVLMPTQYEACSLALLEALAVGTPVVTTNVGWVPDLLKAVPGYAALVSPLGDTAGFSRSLGNLPQMEEDVVKARDFVRAGNNLRVFGDTWAKTIHEVYARRSA